MTPQTDPISHFPRSRFTATLSQEVKIGIVIVPILLFFLFWNLPNYPVISGWDEGVYLQFARNWVQHGELATRNGAVFERLSPNLSVGPTVIVPIGIGLSLAGNTLWGARLVASLYLLATIIGVYTLINSLFGQLAAVVSILLFLMAGHTTFDTLWMGRQDIGEIPALAFLVWALWAWIQSWRKGGLYLVLSTGLIALAVATKAQIIIVVVPALSLIFIADRIYYRKLGWIQTLVPLVAAIAVYVIGWMIVTPLLVDVEHRSLYQEIQSLVTNAGFLHISPSRWIENLKFLFKSEQWLMLFLGGVYGLWRSRIRSLEGLQLIVLPAFAGASLLTYVVFSLPWPRYTYLTLALGALCMAYAIHDLVFWTRARWHLRPVYTVALLALVLAIFIGPRLIRNVKDIATTHDTSAMEFAAHVDQVVPLNSVVLNWEWEIEFYSQSMFIHPPYLLFPALIDQVYNQRYHPVLDQPRIPNGVKYLIVGPFATQVQVFTHELETRPNSLVFSIGPYKLYRMD